MQINSISTLASSQISSAAAPGTSVTTGAGRTPAPAQSEAAAVSTATSILDSPTYLTSVGGKSYSADISQANGTYTLSVPNLPGSSVSGSSLSVAESALNVRIDFLV
jgi:hypothetical protein